MPRKNKVRGWVACRTSSIPNQPACVPETFCGTGLGFVQAPEPCDTYLQGHTLPRFLIPLDASIYPSSTLFAAPWPGQLPRKICHAKYKASNKVRRVWVWFGARAWACVDAAAALLHLPQRKLSQQKANVKYKA